ncbi:MAG: amidohydrolase family protein, partial [Acidimicrobiales bacterium]
EHDPASSDRRKLLLALGFGAVNLAALRRVGLDSNPAGGLTGDGIDPASAAIELTAGTAEGTAPAALPPALTVAGSQPPPPPPEDHVFDIVISRGRVMDPDSGFDGLAAVGIDGDTITAVSTEALVGRVEIDATGRVVAPGFVDLLSYEPNSFGVWLKLADGVTTNLAMHGVNNYAAAFFGRYQNQTPIHYGGAFHHHFMRGFDIEAEIDAPLTEPQFGELESLARLNLEQGFAGISFSPEYSPGTTTDEMERLAAMAADFGHVCFFHARHSDPNPPGTSLEALEEVLSIAARTGVSVHIEHLTSTGGTFVMHQALDLINRARSDGADVTACIYPYDFWGTFLGSSRFALGWQERYRLTETDLQVAGTGERLSSETFGAAFRDNKLVAAMGSIPEEEIRMALQEPWVVVASDAIPTVEMNNHPRGAGTFARTIGHYVRHLGVLDLMTGLAKMTIGPVRRVEHMIPAMARKGRLQRGADADIVIFDPVTIGDRATVEVPAAPSVGIDWVLVGGQIALRDGTVDKTVLAGRPLRSRV